MVAYLNPELSVIKLLSYVHTTDLESLTGDDSPMVPRGLGDEVPEKLK